MQHFFNLKQKKKRQCMVLDHKHAGDSFAEVTGDPAVGYDHPCHIVKQFTFAAKVDH